MPIRYPAPVVHDLAQRFLLGRDPLEIDAFWSAAFDFAAYHGYAGAELRASSALDIAVWDLLGQVAGQPVYALLGGAVREQLRIYNTCSRSRDRSDARLALEVESRNSSGWQPWPRPSVCQSRRTTTPGRSICTPRRTCC